MTWPDATKQREIPFSVIGGSWTRIFGIVYGVYGIYCKWFTTAYWVSILQEVVPIALFLKLFTPAQEIWLHHRSWQISATYVYFVRMELPSHRIRFEPDTLTKTFCVCHISLHLKIQLKLFALKIHLSISSRWTTHTSPKVFCLIWPHSSSVLRWYLIFSLYLLLCFDRPRRLPKLLIILKSKGPFMVLNWSVSVKLVFFVSICFGNVVCPSLETKIVSELELGAQQSNQRRQNLVRCPLFQICWMKKRDLLLDQ